MHEGIIRTGDSHAYALKMKLKKKQIKRNERHSKMKN